MIKILKFDARSVQRQSNDCQRHSQASTRIEFFRQATESGFQVAVTARAAGGTELFPWKVIKRLFL
jgi:hypothetical protein